MQLDAPAMTGDGARQTGAAQEVDIARRHLDALLADAAQLAEDDNLDDRTWAELIVRMVYSTSALRHLAERADEGADGQCAPDALQTSGPSGVVHVDLAPPSADGSPAVEDPPAIDLTEPSTREPEASEDPMRAGREPATMPASIGEPLVADPLAASPASSAQPYPADPYIPESRWRRRRGRHRIDRLDHDYDYFQDLRRVLDELEAEEAAKAGSGPVSPPAFTPQAAAAPSLTSADSQPVETSADSRPADQPGPFVEPDEAADAQATEPTLDAAPAVATAEAEARVPFDEFRRGLAALGAEEPAPRPNPPSSRSVSFQDLAHALARLEYPLPAEPGHDGVAEAAGAPTTTVASRDKDVRQAGPSEAPAPRPGSAVDHQPGAGSSTSPWAEHMLLGALVVVAARRPARWFFRALSGD